MAEFEPIIEVAQAAVQGQLVLGANKEPFTYENEHFVTKEVFLLPRRPIDKPEVLTVYSLTGFMDYVNTLKSENSAVKPLAIHVENAESVRLVSALNGHMERVTYVQARYQKSKSTNFSYNQYFCTEDMNIALQALFFPTEELATLLKVTGNVTGQVVKTERDDGVSQIATIETGIRAVEATVPNPVRLRPYSTFAEVEQPTRTFVFRMRNGKEGERPSMALFEADNQQWANEARANIRGFLLAELEKSGNHLPVIA